MRLVALLLLVTLLASCLHDTSLEDSWPKSKLSACDRIAGADWTKLDAPPTNAEALFVVAGVTNKSKNALWYSNAQNGVMLCLRGVTPSCAGENNNNNGISKRTIDTWTYEFTDEQGQWTVKNGKSEEYVCVSSGR